MKVIRRHWKLSLLLALGLPVAIKAGIDGDYLEVSGWGLFGSSWTGNSSPNLAIGDSNTWDYTAQRTLTVGSNMKAYHSDSATVGTYGADATGTELFSVGMGTSIYDKKNAFEVFEDGRVEVVESATDIQRGNHSGSNGMLMQGQLKWAATLAYRDLEALLPGGAGYDLDNYFTPRPENPSSAWFDEQRNAAVVGQVKAVADPLYTRLNDYAPGFVTQNWADNGLVAWPHSVPWDPSTSTDENYLAATVGEMLLTFGIDFNKSSDGDSIPDLLEYVLYGNTTTASDTTGDYDGDTVLDAAELLNNRSSVWLKDTDGDGLDDTEANPRTLSAGQNSATQLHLWTPNES